MSSDQFDFVRTRATGCRPISPGLDLVHCRQLILKVIEVICGNCLNAINNGSACSVLFLRPPGLFPALRKTLEYSTGSRALKFFYVLETTLSCSKTVLSTLNHCLLHKLSLICCIFKAIQLLFCIMIISCNFSALFCVFLSFLSPYSLNSTIQLNLSSGSA